MNRFISKRKKIITEKKFNRNCPYCGSRHMTVDADIRITGDLQENGTIKVRPWWTLEDELTEAVNNNSNEYLEGFCSDCGSLCNFSWEEGFIKGGGIDAEH